jgi:hypothetical protein
MVETGDAKATTASGVVRDRPRFGRRGGLTYLARLNGESETARDVCLSRKISCREANAPSANPDGLSSLPLSPLLPCLTPCFVTSEVTCQLSGAQDQHCFARQANSGADMHRPVTHRKACTDRRQDA